MKVNEVYQSNSDYLKAADIKGRGQVAVTISDVTTHDFDEGQKIVIAFRGKDKTMALNKTNASIIAEILGDDTDYWVGGEIKLYSARVEYQGKIVDGLRVVLPQGNITGEDPPPAQQPPEPPATSAEAIDGQDEIPF